MTRSDAAEYALRSIELERMAVKHCNRLDNAEYVRLMQESDIARMKAEAFVNGEAK